MSGSLECLVPAVDLVVPVEVGAVVLSGPVPKSQTARGTRVTDVHQVNQRRVRPAEITRNVKLQY